MERFVEDDAFIGPGQSVPAEREPDVPLLPEGYMAASREARVAPQGKWYVAELARREGLENAPPLRVLPNWQLSILEAILADGRTAPAFVVTGRVTEFLGANYILVEHLEQILPKPAPRPKESPGAGQPALTTRPTSPGEPTAEEIMQRLLEHETLRPVVLPDRTPVDDDKAAAETDPEPSAAQNGTRGRTLPEETLLIDRTGRVLPGESWWTFAFEDQGHRPKRPPIRLLPNQLLETAIALTSGGTRGMVLVISGEVTLYQGMNYLLLRKVLIRRDLGNFR